MNRTSRRPALSVRDIVLVALLAAIGGVLSTYIGYIGNLINRLFGVPFGAGQLIAGLHVIWPILARLLIGRFGSATLTGTIKGLVEFLSGGTHGVVIVLISFVEGLLIDVGMQISRRVSLLVTLVVGAVASASNVFLFQAIYLSNVSIWFILVMAGLAFASGGFFGGYLAWDLRRMLIAARLVGARTADDRPRARSWIAHVVTSLVVLALLAGGAYYYIEVFDPFSDPASAEIRGEVAEPYTLRYSEWTDRETTINTEMQGSVTYIPPADYTGVPLQLVLTEAQPTTNASTVRVVAGDGYEASFDLQAVLANERIVLTLEDDALRLVAAGYDGSHWVRQVSRIVIE